MSAPDLLEQPPVAATQAVQPAFLAALRGIWLLTWRNQLTWRKVPVTILGLLALPVLVYITTSSALGWSQSHSLLGSPIERFQELSRRLAGRGVPLRPDQNARLRQVFLEEFGRAQAEPTDPEAPQSKSSRQQRVQDCYGRISAKAQQILDNRQFFRYQAFESRILADSERRSSEPVWTRSGAFYHWLIDFYFFVMLPLNCVRSSGALIRDELQADTLGFLVTRPLSRATLIIVKYLSQTTILELLLLIETLLVFAAGSLRHMPALSQLLPLFLVTQFLAVLAWSALGAFLGLVTNRYMALAIVYGLVVEMGIGRIPTNINTLSLVRHLKTLLAHNPALQDIYEWSGSGVPLSIAALLFAAALFLTLAALLFTLREYHHTAEMQK